MDQGNLDVLLVAVDKCERAVSACDMVTEMAAMLSAMRSKRINPTESNARHVSTYDVAFHKSINNIVARSFSRRIAEIAAKRNKHAVSAKKRAERAAKLAPKLAAQRAMRASKRAEVATRRATMHAEVAAARAMRANDRIKRAIQIVSVNSTSLPTIFKTKN